MVNLGLMSLESRVFSEGERLAPSNCFSIIFSSCCPNSLLISFSCWTSLRIPILVCYHYGDDCYHYGDDLVYKVLGVLYPLMQVVFGSWF